MLKMLKQLVITVLSVFIFSAFFVTVVAERAVVSGISMESTLYDGNNLIVDKISYQFTDPERFDIIVFAAPGLDNEKLIKRVIGLPGETVQIKKGYVYINGKKLTSDIYGKDIILDGGLADSKIKLGKDEYFCMGDNRNSSIDSRDPLVGNVKRSTVLGKTNLRILPVSQAGKIDK